MSAFIAQKGAMMYFSAWMTFQHYPAAVGMALRRFETGLSKPDWRYLWQRQAESSKLWRFAPLQRADLSKINMSLSLFSSSHQHSCHDPLNNEYRITWVASLVEAICGLLIIWTWAYDVYAFLCAARWCGCFWRCTDGDQTGFCWCQKAPIRGFCSDGFMHGTASF